MSSVPQFSTVWRKRAMQRVSRHKKEITDLTEMYYGEKVRDAEIVLNGFSLG